MPTVGMCRPTSGEDIRMFERPARDEHPCTLTGGATSERLWFARADILGEGSEFQSRIEKSVPRVSE